MRLHQTRQTAGAEEIYRRILAAHPEEADAYHLLGVLEFQTQRTESAVANIRRAIQIDPTVAEYHYNLALAESSAGNFGQAVEAYDAAIALQSDFALAFNGRGVALAQLQKPDESAESFRKAITLKPDYVDALCNLGNLLVSMRQTDQAISCLRQAITLEPKFANAYNNLGIALEAAGKLDESIATLRQAIALQPNFPEAMNNLAKSLQAKGLSEEAAQICRRALVLRPRYATAQATLGNSLKDLGQVPDAISAYQAALALRPDLMNTHSSLLLAMLYDAHQTPQAIFRKHVQWDEQFARPLESEIKPHNNDRNPDRVLRIGYVSPDFCAHSIIYFLEEILRHHDPAQVEIFAYADLIHPDAVTERIKQIVPYWRDITQLKNPQVVELVRKDQIDILVDLAGHTADNRMLLFARKPAPIQVNYLGYPATTGLRTMDYRLTDPLADPPGATDEFHTEKLVRLPTTFLSYRPSDSAPPVSPLPALARGHITFGSLNILPKITPEMIRLWAQILRQVPGSRMILKSYLGLNSESVRRRIIELFRSEQIEENRITLLGKIDGRSAHLAIYEQIDIALDTHPYNGTTMTCESLWMGVPVVTLAGKSHVSRVGLSILTNIGLPNLVAQTPGQYVEKAIQLASDIPALAKLRETLRKQMNDSPLSDAATLARQIEKEFRAMWKSYVANAQ
jgi:predicted O-linked N-acetylglucosamine transferase (SPINDLY family)